MRCKNCDYRLWNLRSRNCPECGTPFRVSDYDFALNSVQFCCPHCGQDYYGTGERGHLRPFEFDCVRCKQRVNMDQMILLPTAGLEEIQTQTERMPWFDESRGAFSRWLGTLQMALTRPADLMRLTPTESSGGAAWRFFLVTWLAVIAGGTGLFCMVPIFLVAGGVRGMTVSGLGGMGAGLLIGLAMLFFCGLLWSLLVHGILRATGPTAGGFARTQQAILYSSGANIVSGIPCLGPYFGWIWWVISAVLATREAQRVSGTRASVAVISPVLLAFAGGISLYIWAVSQAMTMRTTIASWPGTISANAATGSFASALQTFSNAHEGALPRHPAELLTIDPALSALDFVAPGGSDPSTLLIGDVPLDQFDGSTERAQKSALAKAAVAVGEAAPPIQRFGDFIFVYGGLDLAKATPDTWLVVGLLPASSAANAPNPNGSGWVDIRMHGGAASTLQISDLGNLVDQQNRTRADAGLPQIPRAEFLASIQTPSSMPASAPTDEDSP